MKQMGQIFVRSMRLLTLATAFVLGGLAGVAATVGFWIDDYSYHRGILSAQSEIGGKMPFALGRDVDPNEPMQWLFSAKGESVFVVTRNGVKTLRLCCDGTEPKPRQ